MSDFYLLGGFHKIEATPDYILEDADPECPENQLPYRIHSLGCSCCSYDEPATADQVLNRIDQEIARLQAFRSQVELQMNRERST